MGGSSDTTSNTASNQASNQATNFATQAAQSTAQNSQQNYGSNTASTSGPSEAAAKLIGSNTGPISQSAVSGYMNPYTQSVIDSTMAQLKNQFAGERSSLTGNAISQGALGGDRAKLAQAALMEGQGRTAASTIGGLSSSAYDKALAAAQADRSAALTAASMLGTQSTGSTAGTANSATQGVTMADTQGTQATSGSGSSNSQTNSSTSQGMGIGQIAGMAMSAMALMSDKRVKEGIEPVGKSFDGQTIYKFRYKGEPATHIGFMAQDVEKKHPGAVESHGGLKMVNYDDATKDAARRGHFADGGAVGYADGGFIIPNGGVPAGFGALQQYQVQQPQAERPQGAAPQQPQDISKMYKLGQQARAGLGNLMDKMNPTDGPNDTQPVDDAARSAEAEYAATSAPAADAGSMGGMEGLSAAGKGTGGAVRGFSDGGSTTTAHADMPNIPMSYVSAPVAPSLPKMSMQNTYSQDTSTPESRAADFSSTGKGSSHSPTQTGTSLTMGDNTTYVPYPTVSVPSVPQAQAADSGGKGSGGAVRGFADGGGIDDFAFSGDPLVGQQLMIGDQGQEEPRTPEGNVPMWGKGTMESPIIGAPGTVIGDIVGAKPAQRDIPQESFSEPSSGDQGVQPGIAAKGWGGLSDWNANTQTPSWKASVVPAPVPEDMTPTPVSTFRIAPDGSTLQPSAAPAGASNTVQPWISAASPSSVQPAPVGAQNLAEPGADQIAPQGIGALRDVNAPPDKATPDASQRFVPQLSERRQKFAEELRDNPALRKKLMAISAGENLDPAGNLAVIESLMNRADMMGTSLSKEGRTTGERGYYAGYNEKALQDPRKAKMIEDNMQAALNGSNVSNYATDNSSGSFGRNRNASGMYSQTSTYGGELFSYPNRYDARGNDRYWDWRSNVGGGTADKPNLVSSAAKDISGRVQNGASAVANGAAEVGRGVVTGAGDVIEGTGKGVTTLGEGLKKVVSKGYDDSGDQTEHPFKSKTDEQTGGLMQRLFGVNFNPLNLTEKERMTMLHIGASLMSNGNPGQGLQAGLNYQQGIDSQSRQAKLDAMKLNMEFAKMTQPVVIGETTDPTTGVTHKQYGSPTFNAETGQMTWPTAGAPQAGQAGLPASAPASYLAPEVSAEDAMKAAPTMVSTMAKKYANFELPAPNAQAMKNPVTANAMQLAEKLKPGFSAQDYKAQQELNKSFTSGKDADEIKSYSSVYHHIASADSAVDALGNYRSSWLNAPVNAVRGQLSSDFIKAKAAAENGVDTAIAEYNKATSGKAITVDERRAWRDKISSDSSPEAMHATYKSFMEYIEGRMTETANKYNNGMKISESDPRYKTPDNMLSPTARRERSRLRGEEAEGSPQMQQSQPQNSSIAVRQPPQGYTGRTATGPRGEKLMIQNGQWVPMQ